MFQFYAARKSRNMGRRAYATCKHIHGLERMHLLAGSIVMMIKALAAIFFFTQSHEIILSKTHVISPTKQGLRIIYSLIHSNTIVQKKA
jgi:hypothetical protein